MNVEGYTCHYKPEIKRSSRRLVGRTTVPVKVVDKETGEEVIGSYHQLDMFDNMDATPFVKFFDPDALLGLSTKALNMMMYIVKKLGYNGLVRIDSKKAMSYTGLSSSSIYRSLQELQDVDLIHYMEKGIYSVNINVFCRGKRLVPNEK